MMKHYLVLFFLLTWSFAKAQDISVTITNIQEKGGEIILDVYDNEKDFLKESKLSKVVEFSGEQASVQITGLEPGIYAIGVFHDVNENNELDINFMGIPKEPIGTSNDAPANFGPPKFKDAKFELQSGETKELTITLN